MRRLLPGACLLIPLAAGCGSEPASLQGSDHALRDASTSRIEWKMEGKGVPDWALWRSTGLIDYANGRGEMVIKGKSDSAPAADALFVGHDSYLGAEVDGTKYWLKQTINAATGADRFMPGPGGTSPDRLLKELIKSSKKVEKLGSQDIRGVPPRITGRNSTRPSSRSTRTGTSVAVDAWIDEQGLPRRVRVPLGAEGAAVIDLFDFGVPVDVEAPPANEIVSEDKFDKVMEKECADVGDLEHANPLCSVFGAALGSGSDSVQISPTETAPTTEGK